MNNILNEPGDLPLKDLQRDADAENISIVPDAARTSEEIKAEKFIAEVLHPFIEGMYNGKVANWLFSQISEEEVKQSLETYFSFLQHSYYEMMLESQGRK